MKNSLCDLNDYLFVMLEDVMDIENNDASSNEMDTICKKAKTVVSISKSIIANAAVELEAVKLANNAFMGKKDLPEMLLPKDTSTEKVLNLPGDHIEK